MVDNDYASLTKCLRRANDYKEFKGNEIVIMNRENAGCILGIKSLTADCVL